MTERAQTNLDFAIGVSILLVTIVAAMTFVPGLFETVDDGRADADQVAASRIASDLVEERLGTESQPTRIDADCTRALFTDAVDYCGNDESDPVDNLVVQDRRNLNVTVENAMGGYVCWDGGVEQVVNESDTGPSEPRTCDTHFSLGGRPTSNSEIAVARRPVSIDGFHATVVVRAW